jgi:signal transduction histidine kinase
MFEVIDQGEGIPSDVLSNVWTKYYKVKPYVKNNSNTGVGLSIVKEILELHNFEYGVESTVGEGSRFWFEAGSFKRGLDKERCV